jgi:hypothetical protein
MTEDKRTAEDFKARGYRAHVILEWDYMMGPKWLNEDNLDVLLFSSQQTTPSLLRVIGFKVTNEPLGKRTQEKAEATPEEISPGME